MAATYPSSIRTFSTKRNTLDVIDASDPNNLQEEVIAIESVIGVNPNLSTSPSSSGTFVTTATAFATLSARLANIETGIVSDSHTQYLRKSGNETIVNLVTSNVAFTIKGASGQTADLQQWKDSSNATVANIAYDGGLTTTKINAPEVNNLIIDAIWN